MTETKTPIKIVFLDRETLGSDITLKRPEFSHAWTEFPRTMLSETEGRIHDADIIITNKVVIDGALIESTPRLKLIAVAATGTNVVDIVACRNAGIAVCNIRNYGATTVAEYTFAAMLSLTRNLIACREEVIEGRWQDEGQFCYFNTPMQDLRGSTLGLIGTGAIAMAVAELGRAFGMTVLLHSLSGRTDIQDFLCVDLQTLYQKSDVISLHCPLTQNNHGMLDSKAFAAMTRRPVLINAARGELIDLPALEAALNAGQVRGVAIDVAAQEPPAAEGILMKLATRRNGLVTPHIAWASVQARQTLADQLINNINAYLRGSPQNLVT